MKLSLTLITLTIISSTALAQSDVFKGVDANGKVIYSNNPAFVKKPEKAKLPPPAIEGIEPYQSNKSIDSKDKPLQTQSPPKGDKLKAGQTNEKSDKTDAELATERLNNAKKSMTDAEVPLEGERTGITKKGQTRLNEEYYSRQEQAKKELNDAQKNYDNVNGTK